VDATKNVKMNPSAKRRTLGKRICNKIKWDAIGNTLEGHHMKTWLEQKNFLKFPFSSHPHPFPPSKKKKNKMSSPTGFTQNWACAWLSCLVWTLILVKIHRLYLTLNSTPHFYLERALLLHHSVYPNGYYHWLDNHCICTLLNSNL
jgi:hypothetical protein